MTTGDPGVEVLGDTHAVDSTQEVMVGTHLGGQDGTFPDVQVEVLQRG